MSTDFAPVFEKKFHDRVVPGLLMLLDDNANPRVQAHAGELHFFTVKTATTHTFECILFDSYILGAALVNFAEDCPKHILSGYLEPLMAKLERILQTKMNELVEKGTKLVLEQVVTTIASVADTAENEFVAYYDRLMPCLKFIIQNANKEEYKLLRGRFVNP